MLSRYHKEMEDDRWWDKQDAVPFTEQEYLEYRTYRASWPMYYTDSITEAQPRLIAYIEQLRAELKALKA